MNVQDIASHALRLISKVLLHAYVTCAIGESSSTVNHNFTTIVVTAIVTVVIEEAFTRTTERR